ncbi:MAG: FAD-dependent oxidoreductase [Chloroflexi bacterium]|nr:FAD-dependent oxidoreductase [Chloroflexota bacterium]
MPSRIVIVGGVAAGASAATKARRTDESAEIVVFERGPYVSFANCGIPYYLSGDIPKVDNLLVVTPELLNKRFRLDLRPNHEVVRLDADGKQIEVQDQDSGISYLERYDKLILATGGRPVKPPIPGIDKHGVFTLTTIPEVEAVKAYARQQGAKDAVVVGAGFIGIEATEALVSLGLRVHLVEMLPQVLPPFDPEMAAIVADHLSAKGVQMHLGSQVTSFSGDEALDAVVLADGNEIRASLAIICIGVSPNLDLARQAGLRLGVSGGIVVDERMQTSDPDIYACGDIVESTNLLTGQQARVPLAGPANKQGRVAGANAAGGDMRFKGVTGTLIVKAIDMTAAKAGLSEREAGTIGVDHFVSFTHAVSHAAYYPGAKAMDIKVVVEKPGGRLIGAQIVGGEGVDKRIDVLATAMYAGLTVEDLEHLDLAYAPPYSSARDPSNSAGFVAANINRREVKAMSPLELNRVLASGEDVQLVDVRTPREYADGRIGNAVLMPIEELRGLVGRLDPSRRTIVYCRAGYRSYLAYRILMAHGFSDVTNLSGGYESWRYAPAS